MTTSLEISPSYPRRRDLRQPSTDHPLDFVVRTAERVHQLRRRTGTIRTATIAAATGTVLAAAAGLTLQNMPAIVESALPPLTPELRGLLGMVSDGQAGATSQAAGESGLPVWRVAVDGANLTVMATCPNGIQPPDRYMQMPTGAVYRVGVACVDAATP